MRWIEIVEVRVDAVCVCGGARGRNHVIHVCFEVGSTHHHIFLLAFP